MFFVHIWWIVTSVSNAFYGVMSSWFGYLFYTGGIITWYKHSRCHVDTCHKHAKYPFRHYKLCKVHHPDVPSEGVSHQHIKKLHLERISNGKVVE